jgi:hypothetical protein
MHRDEQVLRDVHRCTNVAEDMDVRERLGQGGPRATRPAMAYMDQAGLTRYHACSTVEPSVPADYSPGA